MSQEIDPTNPFYNGSRVDPKERHLTLLFKRVDKLEEKVKVLETIINDLLNKEN